MKIVSFLGKSGSGKGTQAERLAKRHNLRIISSGNLLRERMQKDDFVGKHIKEILSRGGLIPTPIIFHLWLHELEKAREENVSGIIFEGSPRKMYEAALLDEVLEFYGLNKDFLVLHVHISDEEAMRRLLERGRHDDDQESIASRLTWFGQEVLPVVSYYQERERAIEINGEQSRDAVEQEIVEKLDDFFKNK